MFLIWSTPCDSLAEPYCPRGPGILIVSQGNRHCSLCAIRGKLYLRHLTRSWMVKQWHGQSRRKVKRTEGYYALITRGVGLTIRRTIENNMEDAGQWLGDEGWIEKCNFIWQRHWLKTYESLHHITWSRWWCITSKARQENVSDGSCKDSSKNKRQVTGCWSEKN